MAREGSVPAFRIGDLWRFRASALDECRHVPHPPRLSGRALPLDEAEYDKDREKFAEAYLHGKRELAFREWLRVCKDAAKVEAVRPS